jgi:hypothetical protein
MLDQGAAAGGGPGPFPAAVSSAAATASGRVSQPGHPAASHARAAVRAGPPAAAER